MRWLLMAAAFTTLFACHRASDSEGVEPEQTERFALQELSDITLHEGERLLVKLVVLNDKGGPVTFTAENLPPFATLAGDTLTLAPGPGSEGETVVTVHASTHHGNGQDKDSTRFTLRVLRQGSVENPRAPEPCNTPMEPVVSWSVSGERVWKRLPSNTCEELFGVWGSSATDVWAVGAKGTIIRWNGSTWTPVASGTDRDLLAVRGTAPDDVWAVGGREGDFRPTLLHWNGERWSTPAWSKDAVEEGPPCCSTRGTPRVLRGVLPFSRTDVWAVGHGSPVEWNGSQLRGYGYYHSASKNHIGGLGRNDWWELGPSGLLWHGVGTSMTNQSIDRYVDLYGLWAFTPQDVWVTGERLSYVNGSALRHGAFAHWDGATWTVEDKAGWPRFRAIWGSTPQDVWAVGPDGTAHREGTVWSALNAAGLAGNHVWGTGSRDAWLVGPGGRVLHLEPAPTASR